jgi:hypothetical protein
MITAGTAGTLILATAVSTAAATLSTSTAAAGTAEAYLTSVSANTAAWHTMDPAGGSTSPQQAVMLDQARGLQAEHQQEVAVENAAAQAKAAAAKAAAKAAADKAAAKAAAAKAAKAVRTDAVTTPSGSPQQIAQQMLAQDGWSGQFSCLDALWGHESRWSVTAENPSSGAYGIPQALPGSQMAAAGSDWQTNAATQIKWGLTYIHDRYGSPCGAEAHEQADGWY